MEGFGGLDLGRQVLAATGPRFVASSVKGYEIAVEVHRMWRHGSLEARSSSWGVVVGLAPTQEAPRRCCGSVHFPSVGGLADVDWAAFVNELAFLGDINLGPDDSASDTSDGLRHALEPMCAALEWPRLWARSSVPPGGRGGASRRRIDGAILLARRRGGPRRAPFLRRVNGRTTGWWVLVALRGRPSSRRLADGSPAMRPQEQTAGLRVALEEGIAGARPAVDL